MCNFAEGKQNNYFMKKVLIISTSLRPKSNSHELALAFQNGAVQAGHNVELITLRHKNINFCIGCLTCVNTGKCVIADDMQEIVGKMRDVDVIVFASPIYYYEMSGQLKTLLDRSNPLYGGDYRFTDIYMLTSAAEDLPSVPERAINGLGGWIECFDRAHLAGTVFAGGVNDPGEIAGHDALKQAYELGQSIG